MNSHVCWVEVRTGGPWYVKDPRGAKLGPYSAAEIVAWFGSLQVAEGAGAWQDLRTVLPALGGGIPFAKAPKGICPRRGSRRG